MKKIKTYIDPPDGYKYGFPKEFPPLTGNIPGWLVENGYPYELYKQLDSDGVFYYNMFTEEVDE